VFSWPLSVHWFSVARQRARAQARRRQADADDAAAQTDATGIGERRIEGNTRPVPESTERRISDADRSGSRSGPDTRRAPLPRR
jgi:hypothetical protein